MSIVDFPLRNAIVIDHGTVTESTDNSQIGKEMFIVAYADQDGFELAIDFTPDYVVAAHLAQEAAEGFLVTKIIERFRQTGGAQ